MRSVRLVSSRSSLGLWLIGAAGNVATTVAIGLAAARRGRLGATALVTQRPECAPLRLIPLENIELGGHEIGGRSLLQTAQEMHERSGLFDEQLLRAVRPNLQRFQRNIRVGTAAGSGSTINRLADSRSTRRDLIAAHSIRGLARDIKSFQSRHRLNHVVVINVASTEPPFRRRRDHEKWSQLSRALACRVGPVVPSSALYALAAIEAGATYINFTPSIGADLPAIRERARKKGVALMGADGKTGETLVRTTLAPLFRERNLKVLSWIGHNILGNRDGLVLADPANKASKLDTKQRVVAPILGYPVESKTTIEYVESLHDWKTSWNHIHFRGFLGEKMHLQFTWQGCDSILAAPLVIDLARLAEYHVRQGRDDVMTHLACFFKSPMDVSEQDFNIQSLIFSEYLRAEAQSPGSTSPRKRNRKAR